MFKNIYFSAVSFLKFPLYGAELLNCCDLTYQMEINTNIQGYINNFY